MLSFAFDLVEDDGEGSVEEEGHGDGGVLEVVEVVRGNGPIWVKGLVAIRAYEEFHGYGGHGACHDEEEL